MTTTDEEILSLAKLTPADLAEYDRFLDEILAQEELEECNA